MKKFLTRIKQATIQKISSLFLKPSIRYRMVLPLHQLMAPDYDEQILEQALRFVAHGNIKGDYLEFGVWKGRSFSKVYNLWHHFFNKKGQLTSMRFYAFDSFEGLPEISSPEDRQSNEFKKGDYAFSLNNFKRAIVSRGVDLERVTIIPGWFDKSLSPETKHSLAIKSASIIFVDCDLYESTVPVLNFITDYIVDGTVLIFDDWFAFRADPNLGEQKAFREWLARNPHLSATEWQRVNWKSMAFIMHTL